MKILMLTPYLPYPPDSGGQIRTLNLLKYLSKSHEITLVSLYKNKTEKKYAEHLEAYCKRIYVCKRPEKPWQVKNIVSSVLSVLPFLIVRNYSSEAKHVVHSLLKEETFDVIHAETFYIMPHIPPTKTPVLLVEQTIEFKVYQHFVSGLNLLLRMALSIDIIKLRFWEIFYWKKANVVAAVSYADKSVIDSCIGSLQTEVIPNGAGDDMFVKTLPKKDLSKPVLLFVGNFSWLQNTEAAMYLINEIMPRLLKKKPDLILRVAGQNVKSKLSNIEHPNIEFIDVAPNDNTTIQNAYAESTLFVAPIYGPGGTRLKILAAMAAGLPIVSSRTGVEGLNVRVNEDVYLADQPEEFIEQIIAVLDNSEIYYKLQQNAYRLVTKHFSWHAIAKKLEVSYQRLLSK